MYEVTVKGGNLEQLRRSFEEMYNVLMSGDVGATVKADYNNVEMFEDSLAPALVKVIKEPVVDTESEDKARAKEINERVAAKKTIVEPVVEIDFDGEIDSEGLPWDARIHTVKKTKNKTGDWKLMRGSDKDLVAKVKAELKAAMSNLTSTPVVSPAPVAELPEVIMTVKGTLAAKDVPLADLPQVVLAPPMSSSNGHTFETFKSAFPMIVGSLITEGKITADYVNQLKEYFKVDQIWSVSDEQKKEMFNSFAQFNFIQKVGE